MLPSRLQRALVAGALLGGLGLTGCGAPAAAPQSPAAPTTSARGQADLQSEAQKAETEAQRNRPRPRRQLKDPLYGGDVSWPQCPKGMGIPQRRSQGLPLPTAQARYVVLGLTNGPGRTVNPCLGAQLAWARARHLLMGAYSVVSYPDARTLATGGGAGPFAAARLTGRLANIGYQQALFNVRTLERLQLVVPLVWVDVEPYPVFPWSGNLVANAAVVRGAVRGYREAGYQVGFYSTPNLWRRVVGDLRLGMPEWRAGGHTGPDEALRRCGADWSFQGGPAVLAQWTDGTRDHDLTCPGTARQIDRFLRRP